MSSSSCSHWWHAPVYVAATVAILIAATSSSLSSAPPSRPDQETQPGRAAEVPTDVLLALHRSGFQLTASILKISPGLVLPADRPATLFAVPDAAVANLSLSAADRLLRYQTVPLRLTLSDILRMPRGTCLPTLLSKKLVITASDARERSISINGVPISRPDLLVIGPHAIHGAGGAFHRLSGPIPDPFCEPAVQWARLVRVLGSRGYVSFSVGLSAVLDAVERDAVALDQVTVFAPVDGGFDLVASPGPVLERAVKRQVAVGRLGIGELAAMRAGEEIRTLARDGTLRITVGEDTGAVEINGVEMTEPEMFVGEGVVVHGIAKAFEMSPVG